MAGHGCSRAAAGRGRRSGRVPRCPGGGDPALGAHAAGGAVHAVSVVERPAGRLRRIMESLERHRPGDHVGGAQGRHDRRRWQQVSA